MGEGIWGSNTNNETSQRIIYDIYQTLTYQLSLP